MITGRSTETVVAEILRQADAKRDFIVDSKTLSMVRDSEGVFQVGFEQEGDFTSFNPTPLFHDQMGTHLGIPGRFYDRLQSEFPDLLLENVNTMLHARDENRMLRTLDGKARSFQSDRYRRLDNSEIAAHIFPIIMDSGHFQIASLDVTDTHFYMQVLAPRVQGEIRKGDVVQAGFILSNSEVGLGALSLKKLIYRLVCTNGMVAPVGNSSHRHLGARQAEGMLDFGRLTDEAQAASDKALWLGVRDSISYLTTQEGFDALLDDMRDNADDPITGHPEKVVKQLAKVKSYKEEEETMILRNLLTSGDLTRWGLANAVTATANTIGSYDRAVEMEKHGGDIMLTMPSAEWRDISRAS